MHPGLLSAENDSNPGLVLESFDIYSHAPEIVARISLFRPAVIVASQVWFPISSLLMKIIELSRVPGARPVLGATLINDVLRVQAAYHGFFDIIDLGQPTSMVLADLERIHQGRSLLDHDRL